MKKSIPYLAILFLTAALVQADDSKGWTSLFNGETLEGWKHSTLGEAEYSVVDGAIKGITVEGSPNTFLLSEKEYGADIITDFNLLNDELFIGGFESDVTDANLSVMSGEEMFGEGWQGLGDSLYKDYVVGIEKLSGDFDAILYLQDVYFLSDLDIVKIQKISKVAPVVLNENGLIRSALKPVKILGKGDIDIKISITASSFSETAKNKIENAGGTAKVQ